MNFRLSDSEERLRAEVCAFLSEELGTSHASDPRPMPPGYMPARGFELKLGEGGGRRGTETTLPARAGPRRDHVLPRLHGARVRIRPGVAPDAGRRRR